MSDVELIASYWTFAGGALPPLLSAWLPSLIFLGLATVMLSRRTA